MRGPRSKREWLGAALGVGLVGAAVAVAELTGVKALGGATAHEIGVALVLFACFPLAAFFPISAMAASVL